MFYKRILKPNRKRMTRSRGAKNNAKNNSKQIIPDAFKVDIVKLRSVYSTTLNGGGTPRVYKEWKIHPNYGFPDNGSVLSSYGLNSIMGSSTSGLYITMKVKHIKVSCMISNLDVFAKIVSFLPIAYATSGVSITNILMDNPHAKSFILAPKGSGGDTKNFLINVFPWQIEGLKNFDIFSAIQNYWCTNTTVGAQYSVVGFGVQSLDDSTTMTNGVALTTVLESFVQATTNNQKLQI